LFAVALWGVSDIDILSFRRFVTSSRVLIPLHCLLIRASTSVSAALCPTVRQSS
jgi:hypothetical protein